MDTDLQELVRGLGAPSGDQRFASYQALLARGVDAIPAIRWGPTSSDWQVRRWAAMCLDQVADEEALTDLVPMLTDSHPRVRLWAVHSIACEHCKDDVSCPVDVVPLLVERVREDPSLRVRRMAVIMLGSEFRDPRALPVLEEVLREDSDSKLRHHAEVALGRLEAVGIERAREAQ
jgi:HEAT repeat protein